MQRQFFYGAGDADAVGVGEAAGAACALGLSIVSTVVRKTL
jgi:hypothetical protein